MKDASGGEAVGTVGTVVDQSTVRADKAHTVGAARVRSPTMPRSTRPHPFIVQRNELAVLAVQITGQNANLIDALAVGGIAVVGSQIGLVGQEIVGVQLRKEITVEQLASRGLAPIVAVILVELELTNDLGGDAQNTTLLQAETNELDTTVDEVFTILDLGEIGLLAILDSGLDLRQDLGGILLGFITHGFNGFDQLIHFYTPSGTSFPYLS